MKITVDKSGEGKHKTIKPEELLIIIGSDHGGYETKQKVVKTLAANNYTIVDVGGFDPKAKDDYPDFAYEVTKIVQEDKQKKTVGILLCGSGTGMVMAANKMKGIRAAFAYDKHSAVMAKHDNNANVLCLRGLNFPATTAARLALLFLQTSFSEIPRHKRRIEKVKKMEQGKRP